MSATAELVNALVSSGMNAGEAAALVMRAVAEASAQSAAQPTARQLRNRRYYETHRERLNKTDKRLNASNKTLSDASPAPPSPPSLSPPTPSPITTPTPSTPHSNASRSRGEHGAKGTRLPADWQPTMADQQFAASLLGQSDRELEKFRDFWVAKSGPNAVKRDWSATWRNWCRNAAERGNTSTGPPRNGTHERDDVFSRVRSQIQQSAQQQNEHPHPPDDELALDLSPAGRHGFG